MATIMQDDGFATPGQAGPKRKWPFGVKIAVTAAMLVYALIFGEMFVRLFKPQPLVPRYVTGSDEGIRANIPGASFRQWTPEVDVVIRYNAAGMRDDRAPPPLEKAPGECRIALLGDSYFVGFESRWEDSFPAQLEQALRARGHDCRVLNFAVSGFGHAEMLIARDARAARWQPDLFIYSIHQTDGLDNLRSGLFLVGEDGTLQRTNTNFLPGIAISDRLNQYAFYRWLQENSHLYSAGRERAGRLLKNLLATLRGGSKTGEADADEGDGADDTGRAYVGNRALNRALLDQIQAADTAMGSKTLFLDIPTSGGRMRYVSEIQYLVGEDYARTLPVVSPLPRFDQLKSPDTKIYLERGHRHWTKLGNHEVAAVTADAIVDRSLLAPGKEASID